MQIAEFAASIRSRRLYGTLITTFSPHWLPATVGVGLDFVFLDTEHIPFDRQPLSWMCRACASLGLPALVRIASPDPALASMALDGGAAGILAPYIESPEQVKALVGAVKYRPLKGVRLQQWLAGAVRPEAELQKYLAQRNEGLALLINVESVPALEALDSLLDVEGLDGVIVGPHDLSCSLGIPEQYRHPRFQQAVKTIISAARARRLGAGIHYIWHDLEYELEWIRLGANIVLHSADFLLLRSRLREDLRRLRSAAGDEVGPIGEEVVV